MTQREPTFFHSFPFCDGNWLITQSKELKKTSCVNVPGSLQYFVESKRVISTSQRKLISHLIYGSRQTCLLTNQTGLFTDTKSSSNKKRNVVIFGQENIESCTAVTFKVKWISKSSFHVQAHSPGAENISIASVQHVFTPKNVSSAQWNNQFWNYVTNVSINK